MRDIVSIGTGTADNQVAICFFTDNPGLWPPLPHRLAFERVCLLHVQFFPLLTVLCSKGLAIIFGEDVPDVSTQDIHIGAYTLFARIQRLHDSLQPSGMTSAPNTKRLST